MHTLTLTVHDEDPAAADWVDRQLRTELLALDVDRVELVGEGEIPPHAKGADPTTVTTIIVGLASSPVLVQLGRVLRSVVNRATISTAHWTAMSQCAPISERAAGPLLRGSLSSYQRSSSRRPSALFEYLNVPASTAMVNAAKASRNSMALMAAVMTPQEQVCEDVDRSKFEQEMARLQDAPVRLRSDGLQVRGRVLIGRAAVGELGANGASARDCATDQRHRYTKDLAVNRYLQVSNVLLSDHSKKLSATTVSLLAMGSERFEQVQELVMAFAGPDSAEDLFRWACPGWQACASPRHGGDRWHVIGVLSAQAPGFPLRGMSLVARTRPGRSLGRRWADGRSDPGFAASW